MATSVALALSSQPSWAQVFEHQNRSEFQQALESCTRIVASDQESRCYADLLRIYLSMCVNASKGQAPTDVDASEIVRVAGECRVAFLSTIEVEAWLTFFDSFPSRREEAESMLVHLEDQMDAHTKRRWLHRKGLSLMSAGNLHEAYELWAPLACVSPLADEDSDDTLCALLIDLGRLSTEMGKYSDAVDIYNQALACSRSSHNQGLSLIRLSNALERMSRPAQADKRRLEYFSLIKKEYPTHCASCSGVFGKEPKFLIPCCKTVIHSECLRQDVSEIEESETRCNFCSTSFIISDVVDPSAVEGRKYKKIKRAGIRVESSKEHSGDEGGSVDQ